MAALKAFRSMMKFLCYVLGLSRDDEKEHVMYHEGRLM